MLNVKASLQWPGLSDQWMFLPTQNLIPTETCLQCQKRSPYKAYKGRGAFLFPFVSKRSEMIQPVPTKAFLQPPKTAALCTVCHGYAHPPPSIPAFLLAQNLSSKWISQTDNMRPKLQWLKVNRWIVHPILIPCAGMCTCVYVHTSETFKACLVTKFMLI